MTAQTDISVFRKELEDAIKEAHAAIDTAVEKFDTYLLELGDSPAPVAPLLPPVEEPEVPEVPVVDTTTPEAPDATPTVK